MQTVSVSRGKEDKYLYNGVVYAHPTNTHPQTTYNQNRTPSSSACVFFLFVVEFSSLFSSIQKRRNQGYDFGGILILFTGKIAENEATFIVIDCFPDRKLLRKCNFKLLSFCFKKTLK